MAMTHPEKAQWFHPTANTPLTADTVFGHSHRTVQWRCAEGHEFPASPTNFVNSAAGGCPVCLNRIIVQGVNCLSSKYPDIAREWHHSNNKSLKVDEVAAGSNSMAWWLCHKGHHTFKMSVGDRTRGKNCPRCKTDEFRTRSIQRARPDWVAHWHPTKNLPLRPGDVTVGSDRVIVWVCDKGHEFQQRPERRAAGYGCSTCSNRKATRGINDAQTRYPKISSEWHPYLNGSTTPDRILPGTTKYWWKCLASGHKYQQSIPHRVTSHGCPDCKRTNRIGAQL